MITKYPTLGLLLLGFSLSSARSQNGQLAAPPAAPNNGLSPFEESLKDIKEPVPWFTWGSDFRIRNEYFDNILTLTQKNVLHEQDYFRFRARLWASISPVNDVSLNTRLATEPREWLRPAGYTCYKGQSGLDMTDGIIDSLNVKWRNPLGQPASLTVGRQDLFLGDGWLVGEGTPYDGSWTFFLDSARLTYELKEQHTTIEAIGIIQDAKEDGWLPPIHNQHRFLTEQNEKGAILSVANSSWKALNPTAYFIYKHDDRAISSDPHNPTPRGGDNADIYTFGARLTGLLADHWKYWVEGAYQFGQKQDGTVQYPAPTTAYRTIDAFGVNNKFGYLFNDPLNNQLSLSYEFLTGDNPKSGDDEMFDVLWGRWPHWGEIGLYSYAAETRIGQAANLHRLGPSWSIDPAKALNLTLSYYALFAEQDVATRGVPGLFSGTGSFRGHFVQTVLRYKFSRHVSGHLWSEFQVPGDYYVSQTLMYFLRAELSFTL